MDKLKYFLTCYFHLNEDFDALDKLIDEFKVTENDTCQYLFIKELYYIIQIKNYDLASNIIEEYGYKILNLEQTERVIVYIYKRLLDQPAFLDTQDFYKDCKVVFCPVCTPDIENAVKFSLINKATVIGRDLQIYICKPCKLMWSTEDIRADNAQNYKEFMKTLGLKGLWKELGDVDYL
jgi:hypothetical protein